MFVDNGSRDGSLERVRALFPAALFLVNGENLGFGEGANRGAARALSAGAHAAFFVNNDVTLPGCSLEPLVARLSCEETIGIVGPRVLYADDRRSPHS